MKPWEKYGAAPAQPDGPWARYAQPEITPEQREVAKGELKERIESRPGFWSASSDADKLEETRGTSTFADASAGIVEGIPFGDEIQSAGGAIPRAIGDWMRGDGFDLGRSFDREMQVDEEMKRRRQERSPVANTVGAVAGGLGLGGAMAKGGVTFLQGAKPTLASLTARGAGEGAAYGAVYGAGEGRGVDERFENAYRGAAVGGAFGGATGGLARIGAGKIDRASMPTADDLQTASSAAYQRAEDAGVIYSGNATQRIANALRQDFTQRGYHPKLQPGAKVALKEVGRLAGQPATLKGLDVARQIAGNAFQPGNRSNNALSRRVTEAIDDLVTNPRAGDIIGGDGKLAAEAISEGRHLYAQSRKLELVQDALEQAAKQASKSGSGANVDNAIRQRLDQAMKKRGFTEAEKQALERAIYGTRGQNALRRIGKMSPTTGGLTSLFHLGGVAMAPQISVPAAAVGFGAKRIADGMSRGNARMVEAIIAGGGRVSPKTMLSPQRRALIEALTRQGAQQLPAYTSP